MLSKIPQLVCILALFTTPKLTPIQWQQIEMRVLQYLESQQQHKTMLVKSLVLKVCQVMQRELDNFRDTSLTELMDVIPDENDNLQDLIASIFHY